MPSWLGSKHKQDDTSIYRKKLLSDPEKARFILESVLNSRGATMVRGGEGLIRVMPMRKEGKPVVPAPIMQDSTPVFGLHTQAFPLRFVGATDMQHVLERVLPPGQVISPDDRRHLIA